MDLIVGLTHRRNVTTLLAIHYLNLAVRYADALIVLKGGKVRAHGLPEDVLTESLIADVYGVNARVGGVDGFMTVTPISSRRVRRGSGARPVPS